MRVYLAGWQASRGPREATVTKRAGVKHRCYTFANLFKIAGFPYYIKGFEGSYQASLAAGVGILMDSGVVSYRGYLKTQERRGKSIAKLPTSDEFLQLYAGYCKRNKKDWDDFLTVDMEPEAASTLVWHEKIEALGLRPMPVFHGDTDAAWLKKYADKGYKYIGLGGSYLHRSSRPREMRFYLDSAFNIGAKYGLEFHGLGMTTPWVMMEYPFRSCDSSWWSRSAGYGSIMRFDTVRERMSIMHVSSQVCGRVDGKVGLLKQNTVAMRRLADELKEEGFDLAVLREDFTERHVYNAIAMMKLGEHASKRQKTRWETLV